VCVPETPLYDSMGPSAFPPGRGRSLTRIRLLIPRAPAPACWDHDQAPADSSSENNSWFTAHCSSHIFFQRGSCSGREQQGKPWLNNVTLTTHPHQQSTLSPCCSSGRVPAVVPCPKFRPASRSSDMLPQAAFSDAGYMEGARKVWVGRRWRAADAEGSQQLAGQLTEHHSPPLQHWGHGSVSGLNATYYSWFMPVGFTSYLADHPAMLDVEGPGTPFYWFSCSQRPVPIISNVSVMEVLLMQNEYPSGEWSPEINNELKQLATGIANELFVCAAHMKAGHCSAVPITNGKQINR